jgi:hypothetical protein
MKRKRYTSYMLEYVVAFAAHMQSMRATKLTIVSER